MKDIIFIALNLLACFHAYTYADWLRKNDRQQAATVIYLLIIISLALPLYRLTTQ